ncbi:hypothetical protein BT93_D0792 [Corymbia citriodora subsp. variegata]|nr:hypothetical protein BT93_D0792 [Corymbia citriodora subsp. variegata]
MAKGLREKEEKEARESQLQQAIANDDVDELHKLIGDEQQLLDRLSKDPFPNTPLHLAVAAGKTQVAMEIAILKPSFARKLNSDGWSPMHLALQYEHYDIVRALMIRDLKLIQVQGRCGITPLHYIAGKEGDDELELLAEFLCACKSSIEDLTSQCETVVHIAVKNHNLKAFEVLFGWLKRVHRTEIFKWKDQDGNTVLHIAASGEPQKEILLRLHGYVNLDVKNFQGKTSREILQDYGKRSGIEGSEIKKLLIGKTNINAKKKAMEIFRNHGKRLGCAGRGGRPPAPKPTPRPSLSELLRRELTMFEKSMSWLRVRNELACTIVFGVAILIATATYQAALSPPGGYWGDNSSNPLPNSIVVTANSGGIAVEKPHEAGNIILTGSKLYQFTALNTTVFWVSIITIWFTAIPLLPYTLPVHLLTLLVGEAYLATLLTEFPKSDQGAGGCIVVIFMSLLAIVLVVPLFSWAKYYKCKMRLRRVATERRVGNFLELKDGK